jgi:hypothetical protein
MKNLEVIDDGGYSRVGRELLNYLQDPVVYEA